MFHKILPRYRFDGFEFEFTEAQWKIIIGIAHGLNNSVIAKILNLSEDSIRARTACIYDMIGFSSRLDLSLWYMDRRKNYQELKELKKLKKSSQPLPESKESTNGIKPEVQYTR
jgi:hypothetical protein